MVSESENDLLKEIRRFMSITIKIERIYKCTTSAVQNQSFERLVITVHEGDQLTLFGYKQEMVIEYIPYSIYR